MKSKIDLLIRDNPMRIEIARFRRRFLGFGGSGMNSMVLVLVVLAYLGIVMLVISMDGNMEAMGLVMFQTAMFCFFGPAMLHGAIAGERERRSWDLLLVAPISKAQIVAGKFMGAIAALGIGTAAMLIPTAIAAMANDRTSLPHLLLGEGISISFCLLVCAWTIFLSSRASRPFMALGTTLGTLMLGLLVLPVMIAALFGGDRLTNDLISYLNPFTALSVLSYPAAHESMGGIIPLGLYGIPQILIYLGLTVVFLVYAEKTLHFADNEVKFIPKSRNDA